MSSARPLVSVDARYITPSCVGLLLLVFAVISAFSGQVSARGGSLADGWLMPFDVNQRSAPKIACPSGQAEGSDVSQSDVYEFAWQSFIALNWPYKSDGIRGEPDKRARPAPIADSSEPDRAVVWETYMSPDTVFTNPLDWDVEWGQPDFIDFEGGIRNLQSPCYPSGYSYGKPFAPGINQPYTNANVPTGPVVDQNKEYLRVEVTLGRSYFNYLDQFDYYDADVQRQAVDTFLSYVQDNDGNEPPETCSAEHDASSFQPLPTGGEFYLNTLPDYARHGMVEVKAAWKVLKLDGEDADVPGRYFRRMMQFPQPDGSLSEPTLMGLVGFHIHRVTPFGHLPSTFEHIDNVTLRKRAKDPLPLPAHPALNPGGGRGKGAKYPNGYEVGGEGGVADKIPEPYRAGDTLEEKAEREAVNVSRVTAIPRDVRSVNRKYQRLLKDSVWSYYQLIGTQNKNLSEPNYHIGPGIAGAQSSNVQNLVNTTLETYTQKGFSCASCHLNAFPHGVDSFPPYNAYDRSSATRKSPYERLHVMSFLLLNAKSKNSPDLEANCARPWD